ncbi:MAG: hypothetical protein WBA41_08160 [Rivularia sp. (in: cyanobacteria)]
MVKRFWEQTGITEAKKVEILETMEKGVYPISETRVLQLLEQAGFIRVCGLVVGWL